MRSSFRCNLISVIMATLVAGLSPAAQAADPLRIFVPPFKGDAAVSRAVSMTVFFEMVKAFSGPTNAERGAWVLYGQDDFNNPSHKNAINEASFPSISADIVIWGNVNRFSDGIVIEPHVTRTPIGRERDRQPEILRAKFQTANGNYDLSRANASAFFDLEPFTLSNNYIDKVDNYAEGIPIFSAVDAPEPVAYTDDTIRFIEVKDKAAYVHYHGGKKGWVKFPQLPREDLSVVHFGRGLIQVLRGDWHSATKSFTDLIKFPSLPNSLRVDANIYLGIARYKLNQSGLAQFRQAASLNAFDRDAASFLLLGLLLDYRKTRDPRLLKELDVAISKHQVLFSSSNPWFSQLRRLAADYRQTG